MANLPDTEKLDLEFHHGWMTIWLNSPENRNGLSTELSSELIKTLEEVRDGRTVRGITLRGRGSIFCAGGDLKSFGKALMGGVSHEETVKMNRQGGEMFALINSMPQVVIALVEGAAIAGGLGLMCCADVIAVTQDAKFSLTETKLGIVPAQIAPLIVERVGLPLARRLMLTASQFQGAEAVEIGLADYAASSTFELETIEREIRESVIQCGPNAVAETKALLLASTDLTKEEQMDMAANSFATCMLSDEGREGILSFLNKQTPSWAKLGEGESND